MELETVLSLAGNKLLTMVQYSVLLAFIVLVALPVFHKFLGNLPRMFGKNR